MGLREVKKELAGMEKADLIKMISEMYKKIPDAKNYLDIFSTGNIEDLIVKYREKIINLVFGAFSSSKHKDQSARKIIAKVRKMKIPELSVALELCYVDYTLKAMEDYLEIEGSHYQIIYNMFDSAVNGIEGHFADKYEEQIEDIVDRGFALGFEFEY